jgi:hypothetical protein
MTPRRVWLARVVLVRSRGMTPLVAPPAAGLIDEQALPDG